MTIEFKPLSDALGAEVIGVNVADDHSDETIAEIREGWLRHKILLFRGQDLTIERQKAFAQRFGKFKISPQAGPWISEHQEVIVSSNIKVDGKEIGVRADTSFGEVWHNDFVQLKEPAGGSFFYAKEVPKQGGDDTWYANQTKAYDALPKDMKGKLEGRHWRYSQVATFKRHGVGYEPFTKNQKRNLPDVCHPFVRTHKGVRNPCSSASSTPARLRSTVCRRRRGLSFWTTSGRSQRSLHSPTRINGGQVTVSSGITAAPCTAHLTFRKRTAAGCAIA